MFKKNTKERTRKCVERTVGFEGACAAIWVYNSINTKDDCFTPCFWYSSGYFGTSPLNKPRKPKWDLMDYDYCKATNRSYKDILGGACPNTINGESACSKF